jgi:hypothetical protein
MFLLLCLEAYNAWSVPCQPCVDMVILSDEAEGPEERKSHVAGSGSSLVVRRTYRFRIRLRPGYLEPPHDDSPLYWHGLPYPELVDGR